MDTPLRIDGWESTRVAPDLGDRDLHIWRVCLDTPRHKLESLSRCLASGEIERASRFQYEDLRTRFIAYRVALRHVLAAYLDLEPAQLIFRNGPQGKPSLAGAAESSGLRFNASHSGSLGLIALTRGREIGVDIEHLREDIDDEEIAAGFFTAYEARELASHPPSSRNRLFFILWTCKEAFVKALGGGLSIPLDCFEVLPADSAGLARILPSGSGPAASDDENTTGLQAVFEEKIKRLRWLAQCFVPAKGYAGAVVFEGDAVETRGFEWEWPMRRESGLDDGGVIEDFVIRRRRDLEIVNAIEPRNDG